MKYRWGVLFILILALGACSGPSPTHSSGETSVSSPSHTIPAEASPPSIAESYESITLPISVYILDDEAGSLSSARTIEELESVYENANEIWGQAGIVIEVQNIQRLTLPVDILAGITQGEFGTFFNAAGRNFPLPSPSLLNSFYAREIGGPNGINPAFTRVFFVTDTPSVHDERVTSHEIGHILGLHHALEDPDRLLYSGTNGEFLTEEEIIVARYAARGLLDGLR